MISTAFILGAGLGTRLRPLTENCPKPLLPVAGRPMICHAMDRLIDVGATRFIVNTHHRAEVYEKVFSEKNYREKKIIFAHEPVLLDTGGGLKNIERFLTENDDSVFVYNGDIYALPALGKLAAAHVAGDAEATLLLRSHGEPRNVKIDSAGNVADMRGRIGAAGESRLFTGIYCVRRRFFRHLKAGKIESIVEAFLRRISAAPGSIRGITDDTGYWYDLGTVAEYEGLADEQ